MSLHRAHAPFTTMPDAIAGAWRRRIGQLPAFVADGILLLAVIFAIPVVILIVGMPIALLVRFAMALALRW